MRKSRLLLFVLSVFVFSSVASSLSCYAKPVKEDFPVVEFDEGGASIIPEYPSMTLGLDNDSTTSGQLTVYDSIYQYDRANGTYHTAGKSFVYDAYNTTFTTTNYEFLVPSIFDDPTNFQVMRELQLKYEYGASPLLEKGQSGSITINGVYDTLEIWDINNNSKIRGFNCNYNAYNGLYAIVYYTDSTYDYIQTYKNEIGQVYMTQRYNNTPVYTITVEFEMLKKPVSRIAITNVYNVSTRFNCGASDLDDTTYSIRKYNGISSGSAIVEVNEKDTGLLSGLLNWVKSIYESVKSIPEKIQSIFSAIAELPQKIWTFISDGLKNLFVPSETKIEEFKINFENLFAERFGALYESGQYITSFFENLAENDTKTTIEIPLVSVPLAGVDYNFGGYTVEIVPVKFKFLLDILKGVLDIIVTVAFINAMKKRFEGILGGENTSA